MLISHSMLICAEGRGSYPCTEMHVRKDCGAQGSEFDCLLTGTQQKGESLPMGNDRFLVIHNLLNFKRDKQHMASTQNKTGGYILSFFRIIFTSK